MHDERERVMNTERAFNILRIRGNNYFQNNKGSQGRPHSKWQNQHRKSVNWSQGGNLSNLQNANWNQKSGMNYNNSSNPQYKSGSSIQSSIKPKCSTC